MNLTVVVKSCQRDRDRGFHDAIRETWGKDLLALGGDLKFVVGGPGTTRTSDEINFADCPDEYLDLPQKTHRVCNWAYLKRWGHIFLCDNDTLVNPVKLLSLPYRDFDYAGGFKGGELEIRKQFYYCDVHLGQQTLVYSWASGGYGYFLSPKAQAVVGTTPPMIWAEDMYVGQVMGPLVDLKIAAFPMAKITTHIPEKKNWSPEILRKWYNESK